MGDKKVLKSFRELKVWKKAYDLCLEIFRITKKFPREERYVLSYQMRKSALSIPSNMRRDMAAKPGRIISEYCTLHMVPRVNWILRYHCLEI
ncbi:MAG: hypothetical protein DRH90_00970 [Deltaproteobacteria bacterium]|nr:MAG: hypothetical protein DRH90_00970 [Deltaproteobacteria bacterium]